MVPSQAPPRRVPWSLLAIGILIVTAGLLFPFLIGNKAPTAAIRAPETQAVPAVPEAVGPDLNAMLMRLFGGTVLVLGLCVGVLLGCRRWLARSAPAGPNRQLELLGAVRIGRSRVYLVRARGQRLLAGVDVEGVKLLVPVPPAAEEASPAA